MPRANYQSTWEELDGQFWLILRDSGGPASLSLTNDLEDAVRHETARFDKKWAGVVYTDSAGAWDGFDPKTERFILLDNPHDWEDAVQQYIKQVDLQGQVSNLFH